jgi:EAL domain-containing protein (putative c-di-GMP-specific phosphodiesterase class I)
MAADDVSVDDPARRLLTHMPFDIVKIDLGQVWESAQSGPRLALLRDAALSRHARVVAERVETSEQLVALRDLEFGAGQGFLLGRPDASLDVSVVDVQRLQVDVPEVESVTDVPLLVGTPIGDGPVDDEDELEIPPERRAIFLPPAVRPMLEAGSGPA